MENPAALIFGAAALISSQVSGGVLIPALVRIVLLYIVVVTVW